MTSLHHPPPSARLLLRMERDASLPERDPPSGVTVRAYDPARDHDAIRLVYAASFGDEPWPQDWTEFADFTPDGVFVAHQGQEMAGYVISFPRSDHGYISVVAVRPDHQRRGIASALVTAAAAYLRSENAATLRIDAFGDSPAAVATYWRLGFRVYDMKIEQQTFADTAAG